MKRFYPLYFFRFFSAMVKEFINLKFYWKKMTELESSGELKTRGLRLDRIKRLYFVKNIEPEALMYGETENGGVEKFEKQFVGDALRLHNELFIKDGSIELVKASFKRIKTKDYYAYLIWIGFKFQKLKFWNFVYLVAYIILAFFTIRYAIHIYPVISAKIHGWITLLH